MGTPFSMIIVDTWQKELASGGSVSACTNGREWLLLLLILCVDRCVHFICVSHTPLRVPPMHISIPTHSGNVWLEIYWPSFRHINYIRAYGGNGSANGCQPAGVSMRVCGRCSLIRVHTHQITNIQTSSLCFGGRGGWREPVGSGDEGFVKG